MYPGITVNGEENNDKSPSTNDSLLCLFVRIFFVAPSGSRQLQIGDGLCIPEQSVAAVTRMEKKIRAIWQRNGVCLSALNIME